MSILILTRDKYTSMLQTITIQPDPERWPQLTHISSPAGSQDVFGRPLQDWRRETRRLMLGFDDGPVIVTGHQASFWHPGILARFEATEAYAVRCHAAALVELVVDQDTNDPLTITMPDHVEGMLCVRDTGLSSPSATLAPPTDVPVGLRPSVRVAMQDAGSDTELNSDVPPLVASARRCVHAMREELNRHSTEPNLALQVAKAHAAFRQVRFGIDSSSSCARILLPVTSLVHLPIWEAIIKAIACDPEMLHAAYNAAVRQYDSAGMSELSTSAQDGMELPLWVIDPDTSQRRRAWASDLQTVQPARFLPRALLTTTVVRLALADLMVHGLGGMQYEQVTDTLIRTWLGVEPAPFTTVSATVVPDTPNGYHTMNEYRSLRQRSRWTRYNLHRMSWTEPGFVEAYEQLLRTLDSSPRRSMTRRQAYAHLKQLQHDGAQRYAAQIAELDRESEQAAGCLVGDSFAVHRTAPFMMYDGSDIAALRIRLWRMFQLDFPGHRQPTYAPFQQGTWPCGPDSAGSTPV